MSRPSTIDLTTLSGQGDAQPGQGDRDEPPDRRGRRERGGGGEGVQAEGGELVRGDIVPQLTGCRALDHQVLDEVAQLLMSVLHVCAAV